MKYLLLLLLIIFTNISISQTIRFNNVYPELYPTMRNIVTSGNNYILIGGGGDTIHVITMFIDSIGNLISVKRIKKYGAHVFHGVENSLSKTIPMGFVLAGSDRNINSNVRSAMLFKFNSQFDTVWTKKYFTDTFFVALRSAIQCKDNGFMMVGDIEQNNDEQALLIKTDSSGNMEWYKKYGGYYYDDAMKITPTLDNCYLIGGTTMSFTVNQNRDWYIFKVDSIGTLKWQGHFGNTEFGDGRLTALITYSDSGFVAGGAKAILSEKFKAHIIKFDKNLISQWDRTYLFQNSWTVCYSLLELPNRNIIAVGGEEYASGIIYGFIMQLTPNGDIIWKRNYYYANTLLAVNEAHAVIQTHDKGFAFTGVMGDYYAIPQQQAWLVKTDSLGCDGSHSCDDTAMFVSVSNLSDTICFGDSVHISISFGGRSAPYTLQSSTDFAEDSIYYFDTGNDTITRSFTILPQQENVNYNFTAMVTDPWGATKTENFNFYVKPCSTSVASNREDILKYQIYPNPAKEILIITSTENIPSLIFLLNMQSEILTQTYLQNKTEINLNNFSQGIYFVKIVTVKGVLIKKFIKE